MLELKNFKEKLNLKIRGIFSKNKIFNLKKTFLKFNKFSDYDQYMKLIKTIKTFKNDKVKEKKVKPTIKSASLIKQFSNSEKYQQLIETIRKFKINKAKRKTENKINTTYLLIKEFFKSNTNKYLFQKLQKLSFFRKQLKIKKEQKSNEKFIQKIGIVFYGDHNLLFLSANIDLNNRMYINGLTEIPIPGNVIGDSMVEDSNELANIALDSINLLDLMDSPLLVILSSSFFNIHTFNSSDLKQISPNDSKVQSKSPYLPGNTLIDFLRMSDNNIPNELVRTIYSKKDFIESWTNTLSIIDLPVIGIIPAAPHIFDAITNKVVESTTILIDIEKTTTTLLVGSNFAQLNSHKLPFGSALYVSNNLNETALNYFERVLNSVKLILKESDESMPENIYVMGNGLDQLIDENFSLPDGFRSISELNLSSYSYLPKKMDIHEVISGSIDSTIESLASIVKSCV